MSPFCPCGFEGWDFGLFSRAWHERHLHFHFAVFPSAARDTGTVANLRWFIERAYTGNGEG